MRGNPEPASFGLPVMSSARTLKNGDTAVENGASMVEKGKRQRLKFA